MCLHLIMSPHYLDYKSGPIPYKSSINDRFVYLIYIYTDIIHFSHILLVSVALYLSIDITL